MRMRARPTARPVILAGVSIVLAAASFGAEAKTARQRDFVIAGSEGYGTQECLASQSQCGRIVADAWCEAKGFKAALAYRPLERDEITGSAAPARAAGKPVENFLISCKE